MRESGGVRETEGDRVRGRQREKEGDRVRGRQRESEGVRETEGDRRESDSPSVPLGALGGGFPGCVWRASG